MARRDELQYESGQTRGVDFISAPKVRSQRKRFVRTALGGPRGLIARIATFFGGRSSPFRASAVAFAIDRELRFSQGIKAADGRVSLAPNSTALESLGGRMDTYAREACTRADNSCDAIGDSMRQEELWLDQCRPEQIIQCLTTDLGDSEQETRSEMRGRMPLLNAAREELQRFRYKHAIDEDVSHGKVIDSSVIGQLGLILIGEFLVNASYQSTFVKDGVVGGIVIAFGASCVFALFGIGLGLGVQLKAKSNRESLLGYALIAVVIALAAWFISLLSLARVAGEHGAADPYGTASAQIWANPAAGLKAMTDLVAFAFAIVSSGVIIFVAYKFVTYAGGYIGLRKRGLALQTEQAKVQQLVADAKSEFTAIGEKYKLQLDKAPDFIVHCKAPIRSLVVDHENALQQFRDDAQDLEHAARLFDAYIRENGGAGSDAMRERVREHLDSHLRQLEQRHVVIAKSAELLCAREDVNDKSVADGRLKYTLIMERVQSALDELIGHAPLASTGSTSTAPMASTTASTVYPSPFKSSNVTGRLGVVNEFQR